ncbi:MAG: FGGY family carbohydrate kinase, partial [Cyanobacteria bacterium J06598_3]
MTLSLGMDFGTSGGRAIATDAAGNVMAQSRYQWAAGEVVSPISWQQALWCLLRELPLQVRTQISRIAINGTSATMLLCDGNRQPLTEVLLYNNACGRAALDAVRAIAPRQSPVMSATSTLVKAMWLYQQRGAEGDGVYIAHQADFIAALLHRRSRAVTDYHNALKLGYDVQALAYPDWLLNSPVAPWLPDVVSPGAVIGPVHPAIAQTYALPTHCQICAGTTDSIAAFLASGAAQPGDAVTSLGSTLVLKLLSREAINNQAFGIYSHRFGDLWLVGGASNTGGAVLQQFFNAGQLKALSEKISMTIDLSRPSEFDYYPLTSPGER